MLPVRDDVRARRPPLVVLALIALNALAFAHLMRLAASDAGAASAFVESWGLVPREFLRGLALPGATGQIAWATPVSAMFLHAGLVHLAGNMLFLWVFGAAVEDLLGHARFALFYLACGLAAAAAQIASDPQAYAATIGASGAVAGVLGAYLVSYPLRRLRLLWPPIALPAGLFLLLWIAVQVASGLGSWRSGGRHIAWWAHVGGFAAGALLARAMWVRRPTRSRRRI